MRAWFALLSILLVSACDNFVGVTANMVAVNPYTDTPVQVKMNGKLIGPIIAIKGSEGFKTEIQVPSDPTGPSPADIRTTAWFNFVNSTTGKDLSPPEKCPVGGKVVTALARVKVGDLEGLTCEDNYYYFFY